MLVLLQPHFDLESITLKFYRNFLSPRNTTDNYKFVYATHHTTRLALIFYVLVETIPLTIHQQPSNPNPQTWT